MSAVAEMALYEITSELSQVTDLLVESGGELTPEIEEALDALEGALEEKVERTVHVIRTLEGQAEAARVEADRLKDLQRTRSKAADRLKDYLQAQLRMANVKKIEADTCVVRRQRNGRPSISYVGKMEELPEAFRAVRIRGGKLAGLDPEELPPEVQERASVEADTSAAYEEWKAGAELPEGFRVERGEHLRIQ